MNRLGQSTSPYLRQHADNPVEWWTWSEEALAWARAQDKPILLSVGYSACHWCHVMAHESFENPDIAALMNANYVNIKVDREERPDIDAIYQKVVALMGQGGGWPLTVFLTPDQRPFYGGTYFPPDDRYGRPGFARVLSALAQLWAERREEAEGQAEVFMRGLADIARSVDEDGDGDGGNGLSLHAAAARTEAGARLLGVVDPQWGGFGRAPKFPNVPSLGLLLSLARAGSEPARAALELTLEKMWRGGIYDHLRGGFARYSTDQQWLVPHFEKMLYDNAMLLELYAGAGLAFGATGPRAYLRRVVEETAAYLLTDMHEAAGFVSATDADSEGVEGKYFCWTPAQLADVLGPGTAAIFARAYGVSEAGNFEDGMSILHLPEPLGPALDVELAPARARLLAHRYNRVAPLRDDKILTAWNALAISAFCTAATAAEVWGEAPLQARWTAAAEQTCAAILSGHRDAEGRLLRASFAGKAHTRAVLEDVALLARACLDLHELTLEPRWHDEAEALAAELLAHYPRPLEDGGGLFMTADDGEALIERTESQHDGPLPSGLTATVEVLGRLVLAPRDDDPASRARAAQAEALLDHTLRRYATAHARPTAFAGLIAAAAWRGEEAVHVTLRAASPAAGQGLAAALRRARPRHPGPVAISFVRAPALDQAEAIVCRAQTCALPVRDAQALVDSL